MNNNEIKNSKISNNEIINREISNSEIRNSEIRNSEIRNSEIRNSEIRNNEIKNNEINNDSIIEAIGLLDDDLIEETRRKRDAEKSGKGIHLIRKFGVVPVAACIVLIIGSISVYAAARIAGVLKVHENITPSGNEILYSYEIEEGYRKIPMSEITGEAVHYADHYQEGNVSELNTESPDNLSLKKNSYVVSFDTIEAAADFIGYHHLKIEPFKVVGQKATVFLHMEEGKNSDITKDDASGEKLRDDYVLGGIQIGTDNLGGNEISKGMLVTSRVMLYTENSSMEPTIKNAVLDGMIWENDGDISIELTGPEESLGREILIQDYNFDDELQGADFDYGIGNWLVLNGYENTVDKENVIENDREFEIVTVASRMSDEIINEIINEFDPASYRFMVLYQKNVIHVENDIIYTLQVYYSEGEQYEAEEIIQKWMNSF